jgi:hypothetical protein
MKSREAVLLSIALPNWQSLPNAWHAPRSTALSEGSHFADLSLRTAPAMTSRWISDVPS